MGKKKDPFDIKLTNNMSAKDKYYKDTFYSSSPGVRIKKPGMKLSPQYKSAGGKIFTGRD
jgi:hypothetical protein